VAAPSANLLDSIFQCQQRQEWYREFAQLNGEGVVEVVGSLSLNTPMVEAAGTIRAALEFEPARRGASFIEAFRLLSERAEAIGILVMVSGVVGSDTHRTLDPQEFRGFALVDDVAPTIFVNGADTRAAQIFTLVHELVHVWLGVSALSDADLGGRSSVDVERWCNRVAGEVLVPAAALQSDLDGGRDLPADLDLLARKYKASTLVVLRRAYDLGHLSWERYRSIYRAELDRVLELAGQRVSSGGDFYNTLPVRVSKRFARAVVTSTLEGQTLYSEAFQVLGFRRQATFDELASRLGVI
jgi:Zn-dependent peptidase ImmA (M78 family)